MLIPLLVVFIALVTLVYSADRFVLGSASLAKHLGVSPLLVGMLVIGFGTSVPELLVSTMAAVQNSPQMALGNAFGSNISNIALIIALSAMIRPLPVKRNVIFEELTGLAAITVLIGLLLLNGIISRLDAMILLLVFILLVLWSIRRHRLKKGHFIDYEIQLPPINKHQLSVTRSWFLISGGLVLLIGSSKALVWGAVHIAAHFGLSELVIGLTVVAIGTSIPELASSIMAARRGEHELALGNILGSNVFNTLLVVGVAAFIQPIPVTKEVIMRDFPLMLGLTLSLFVFGLGKKGTDGIIGRWKGAILLLIYGVYTAFLIGI